MNARREYEIYHNFIELAVENIEGIIKEYHMNNNRSFLEGLDEDTGEQSKQIENMCALVIGILRTPIQDEPLNALSANEEMTAVVRMLWSFKKFCMMKAQYVVKNENAAIIRELLRVVICLLLNNANASNFISSPVLKNTVNVIFSLVNGVLLYYFTSRKPFLHPQTLRRLRLLLDCIHHSEIMLSVAMEYAKIAPLNFPVISTVEFKRISLAIINNQDLLFALNARYQIELFLPLFRLISRRRTSFQLKYLNAPLFICLSLSIYRDWILNKDIMTLQRIGKYYDEDKTDEAWKLFEDLENNSQEQSYWYKYYSITPHSVLRGFSHYAYSKLVKYLINSNRTVNLFSSIQNLGSDSDYLHKYYGIALKLRKEIINQTDYDEFNKYINSDHMAGLNDDIKRNFRELRDKCASFLYLYPGIFYNISNLLDENKIDEALLLYESLKSNPPEYAYLHRYYGVLLKLNAKTVNQVDCDSFSEYVKSNAIAKLSDDEKRFFLELKESCDAYLRYKEDVEVMDISSDDNYRAKSSSIFATASEIDINPPHLILSDCLPDDLIEHDVSFNQTLLGFPKIFCQNQIDLQKTVYELAFCAHYFSSNTELGLSEKEMSLCLPIEIEFAKKPGMQRFFASIYNSNNISNNLFFSQNIAHSNAPGHTKGGSQKYSRNVSFKTYESSLYGLLLLMQVFLYYLRLRVPADSTVPFRDDKSRSYSKLPFFKGRIDSTQGSLGKGAANLKKF